MLFTGTPTHFAPRIIHFCVHVVLTAPPPPHPRSHNPPSAAQFTGAEPSPGVPPTIPPDHSRQHWVHCVLTIAWFYLFSLPYQRCQVILLAPCHPPAVPPACVLGFVLPRGCTVCVLAASITTLASVCVTDKGNAMLLAFYHQLVLDLTCGFLTAEKCGVQPLSKAPLIQ